MSISNEVAKSVKDKIALEKSIMGNLLCSAIEGGSNYWYMIEDHNKKEIPECEFLSELLNCEGGQMTVSSDEGEKIVSHVDTLKAWNTFSTNTKYSRHYQDAINENDDATTGDVFFQLIVFGEVIFG